MHSEELQTLWTDTGTNSADTSISAATMVNIIAEL